MNANDNCVAVEIGWLTEWYVSQCNGVWEHRFGLSIRSLDNPGWLLELDLEGTEFAEEPEAVLLEQGEPPSERNGNIGGAKWMRCAITQKRFVGAGDAGSLGLILAQLCFFLRSKR